MRVKLSACSRPSHHSSLEFTSSDIQVDDATVSVLEPVDWVGNVSSSGD